MILQLPLHLPILTSFRKSLYHSLPHGFFYGLHQLLQKMVGCNFFESRRHPVALILQVTVQYLETSAKYQSVLATSSAGQQNRVTDFMNARLDGIATQPERQSRLLKLGISNRTTAPSLVSRLVQSDRMAHPAQLARLRSQELGNAMAMDVQQNHGIMFDARISIHNKPS